MTIVYVERYYWRIGTSLLSTVVVNLESDECGHIAITSGGGQMGPFLVTWGAQSAHSRELQEKIRDICCGHAWELVP